MFVCTRAQKRGALTQNSAAESVPGLCLDQFLPTSPTCCVGERGGTSAPGRAFSLRSDRAESSRGVGPPAAEKENPPFFIVKDAVECDGLISYERKGRGIPERKEPTRVIFRLCEEEEDERRPHKSRRRHGPPGAAACAVSARG